jgi:hypothetical protein
LRERTKDGSTREQYLMAAAARGNTKAMQALEGPPFPDALDGLWHIFERLDALRGVGFNGPERFTPGHIADGARLFGWTLEPHEVEALVALDLVTLYPGDEE